MMIRHILTLKTESCRDANFAVTGGTVGSRRDNFFIQWKTRRHMFYGSAIKAFEYDFIRI